MVAGSRLHPGCPVKDSVDEVNDKRRATLSGDCKLRTSTAVAGHVSAAQASAGGGAETAATRGNLR